MAPHNELSARRVDQRPLSILLTADPEIPVPPTGYGGIERIVDGLAREFAARGHKVALMAHAVSCSPVSRLFAWPGHRSRSRIDALRNALALTRAVRAFRPDVLHSFSRLAYLLPLLPTRLPKLMSYQRHTGGLQVRLAAQLGRQSLHFTGCSDFICAQGRLAGGNWTPIHNFVETEKFTFVPQVAADAPLVFLSRIERIKGPDIAIAIARAAGRRLLLAGNHATSGAEGDFWANEIVPHLGRDGIEWVGEVNDTQKNELLGRAAALLVPIQWEEPFGIVFAEALAAGTPVISCPRGALPEIVQSGQHGFLINSVQEGIAAVDRLGAVSRAACRQRAVRHFCGRRIAGQYLGLYATLICGEGAHL